MIPKVVHYCWLSGEPIPTSMLRCIGSWERNLPGYTFKLWDAAAAKAIHSKWVDAAITARNWAFAADYIRTWALYFEGGIYLDCDVEVLKDFEPLLGMELILCEEGGSGMIEAAVMGAQAGNALLKDVLASFGDEQDMETMPERINRILGGKVELLPSSAFSPKDWKTGKMHMTQDTYAIHHFAGSWLSVKERWAQRLGWILGDWAVPCTRWVFHRFGK